MNRTSFPYQGRFTPHIFPCVSTFGIKIFACERGGGHLERQMHAADACKGGQRGRMDAVHTAILSREGEGASMTVGKDGGRSARSDTSSISAGDRRVPRGRFDTADGYEVTRPRLCQSDGKNRIRPAYVGWQIWNLRNAEVGDALMR
jgi:hypothetical protein